VSLKRYALLLTLVALRPAPARGELEPNSTTYRNKELGMKIGIPEGWQPSVHTGFPAVLLWLTAPQRGSINLATDDLAPGQDLRQYVRESMKGFYVINLKDLNAKPKRIMGEDTWLVSAVRGSSALRQVYSAHGRRVVILTLACPPHQLANGMHTLEELLGSLEIAPGREQP
jgi:hypothetical protein